MDFIKKIVEKKGPEISDYQALHVEIERIGRLLEQPLSDITYNDLLDIIMPVLSVETMQGFAFHKPHGYSGDYEIIDKIYRIWKSENELFSRWDDFFHAQEATIAVRNRKKFFLKLLASSLESNASLHVLNVGSGPGRDMLEFFQDNPDTQVFFDCVDYDKAAVAYASELCSPHLNKINFFEKNVFRFMPERKYDIVWSAGVFDYLDDKQFVFLLKKLRSFLEPEGSVVIGNFSTINPTKKYMELFGKWFLCHRSKQELIDLAIESGVEKKHISVVSEPLGVNLFLRIK
ncbi:MAG: class I SAM-dependent methyltransferase [Chlorobiaceae bacterium]|jgi:extracellular factor (EF) 3-hydroxypalmitic acid methyl ester biosynthesis protein|nr:class I SAM-dependent methyltransferase [Chlorobiaceae bacterium]NTV17460.1 class I SAM-dependent methyltransferase [Chlorobiaceae bacterium]